MNAITTFGFMVKNKLVPIEDENLDKNIIN